MTLSHSTRCGTSDCCFRGHQRGQSFPCVFLSMSSILCLAAMPVMSGMADEGPPLARSRSAKHTVSTSAATRPAKMDLASAVTADSDSCDSCAIVYMSKYMQKAAANEAGSSASADDVPDGMPPLVADSEGFSELDGIKPNGDNGHASMKLAKVRSLVASGFGVFAHLVTAESDMVVSDCDNDSCHSDGDVGEWYRPDLTESPDHNRETGYFTPNISFSDDHTSEGGDFSELCSVDDDWPPYRAVPSSTEVAMMSRIHHHSEACQKHASKH